MVMATTNNLHPGLKDCFRFGYGCMVFDTLSFTIVYITIITKNLGCPRSLVMYSYLR